MIDDRNWVRNLFFIHYDVLSTLRNEDVIFYWWIEIMNSSKIPTPFALLLSHWIGCSEKEVSSAHAPPPLFNAPSMLFLCIQYSTHLLPSSDDDFRMISWKKRDSKCDFFPSTRIFVGQFQFERSRFGSCSLQLCERRSDGRHRQRAWPVGRVNGQGRMTSGAAPVPIALTADVRPVMKGW